MSKKMTAVESVINEIMTAQVMAEQGDCLILNITDVLNILSKAKAMEKEQIENAFNSGVNAGVMQEAGLEVNIGGKNYYKETYEQNESKTD